MIKVYNKNYVLSVLSVWADELAQIQENGTHNITEEQFETFLKQKSTELVKQARCDFWNKYGTNPVFLTVDNIDAFTNDKYR